MASAAYDPDDPLIDLSSLFEARATAAHTTLASLDRQQQELQACIAQRQRELEVLAAENAHIQRRIDAARALQQGLLAEHQRAFRDASRAAATRIRG